MEVRAFNPPSVGDPFGILQRDHRKLVVVDGGNCLLGRVLRGAGVGGHARPGSLAGYRSGDTRTGSGCSSAHLRANLG